MPMLELDEGSLYYNVYGSGMPIVFIHPPLLSSEIFHYQIDELSRSFSVITFDIRGHGRSSLSKSAVTYPLIAEDIKRLLDHLGVPKAYLCGYSTGGSVVLEFLLKNKPSAFGGIVISGMSEVHDHYNEIRISLASKLATTGTKRLLALAISWGNSNTYEVFKSLYKTANKGDIQNIKEYFQYSLYYNCTKLLATINEPILLVFGEKDKSFHSYAKLLNDKLPKSELTFIKEKHQIPTKAAKEVNLLIKQFIEKH